MRTNRFDGYYNVDFETFPDISILGEWIAQHLPNIGFVEVIHKSSI